MLLLHHPTEKHKKSKGDPLSSPSVTQHVKELAKGHIMSAAPLSLKQFSFPKTIPSPNKQREFPFHILFGLHYDSLEQMHIYSLAHETYTYRKNIVQGNMIKLQIDTLI
jgi:hypothetical protein